MKKSSNTNGGSNMKEFQLLCFIMEPDEEKYFSKVLKKAKYKFIMNATGTASSSLLEYFGLEEVDKKVVGEIEKGMMILVGFENEDTDEDLTWMANKITALRIFDDEQGVMNKSIVDADGDILCISQFTLHAQTKKGNRPSYIKAAKGEIAEPLYQDFCNKLKNNLNKEIQKGIFGADMKVSLLNDGPVTICIDSKNKQ